MAKDPEVTKPDYCVAYSLVYKGRTPGGSLSIEKMKVFALLDYYQARESNSVVNQDSIEGKVEIDKDDLGLASKLVEMHRLDTISIRASYRTKDYDKQENELCRKLAEYVLHQLEMIDILNHPELSTF